MTALATPTTAPATSTGEPLLRLALKADAIVTGANGAAYLAGATLLDGVLGVDAALLQTLGAGLLALPRSCG